MRKRSHKEEIIWNYTPSSNSWFGTFNGKHIAEIHYDPIYEVYGLFYLKQDEDLYGTLLEAQAAASKSISILM